jgi:hypothetical protein
MRPTHPDLLANFDTMTNIDAGEIARRIAATRI